MRRHHRVLLTLPTLPPAMPRPRDLQSKVGPFGACVTREGSWCNYISVPNTPEGE